MDYYNRPDQPPLEGSQRPQTTQAVPATSQPGPELFTAVTAHGDLYLDQHQGLPEGFGMPATHDYGVFSTDGPSKAQGQQHPPPVATRRRTSSKSSHDKSNSEESEANLESKRKAQNRAAQRAFRERKEKKVRDLEAQLTDMEEQARKLADENEVLRQENTVINTKNQVLQQRQHQEQSSSNATNAATNPRMMLSFPPEQFYTGLLENHATNTEQPSFIEYNQPESGDVMLGAGALWQRVMENNDDDSIDLEFLVAYLKDKTKCDGFGPVWTLADIQEAIRLAAKLGRVPPGSDK